MKRIPSQSQPRRITGTDPAALAAAIYALELKRKSLRNRHAFISQTLAGITRELEQIEQQMAGLQARHQEQLRATRLHPDQPGGQNPQDDNETFTISY